VEVFYSENVNTLHGRAMMLIDSVFETLHLGLVIVKEEMPLRRVQGPALAQFSSASMLNLS
jgi:hypothetical protein